MYAFEIISTTMIPNDAGSQETNGSCQQPFRSARESPGSFFPYARVAVAALAVSLATKLERGYAGRVAIPG